MANLLVNIVYVLVYAAIIIFVDVKYLRHDFWKRLIVNVFIVVVAVVIYYLFLVNL